MRKTGYGPSVTESSMTQAISTMKVNTTSPTGCPYPNCQTERNMSGNTEMTDAQQAITVHNVALTPVEFNGLRVVTLAMIDRVRQRPEGTARVTFNMHKDRLLEGKDYFVCDTYEAKLLILTQFFSLSQDIQKAGPTRGASDHKIVGVLGCNSFVTFMYSFITQYAQSMAP